jgi:hypothetical protein
MLNDLLVRRRVQITVLAGLVVAAAASGARLRADERLAELAIQSIRVRPERVEMRQPWDVTQLLITGELESGQQIDLTRSVRLIDETSIVAVSPQGQIQPLADGQQTLRFEVAGQTVQVEVTVSGLEQPGEVSFVRDVAPGLSKMGCNAGTCHGSKDGQQGFKLSLRGYDFEFDHRALTDDIAARRFNRANSEQSLMLLKATGSIPHVGGAVTKPGQRHYELLRRWIAGGASLDLDAPRVTRIELLPQNPILPRAQLDQQIVVLAHYSDGTARDVTADAFVESGNIEILSTDPAGLLTTLRRGEAPVLARYEGAYAATTITIMGDRTGFAWNDPQPNNYIDERVFQKLQRVKILPSELCTDEQFIRRVQLDLTGLLPTADEVRQFVADPRPTRTKRDELIDQLIGSPAYVEHWTNKWADLLQVNRKFLGDVGASALRVWIQEAMATNQPYNEFAHQILTASGSTREYPAAAYWKVLREPTEAMENTTHLFLAVRFNCNKCHDHPFERWTQDQYYQLAAYFAQVGRKEDPAFSGQKIGGSAVDSAQPLVEVIYDSGSGEATHDRTGQVTPPSVPFGDVDATWHEAARREQLARWIVSADNVYFASSYVNRLWGYLLGVGLIEPIDDIRAGNPATNPELLQAMTRDFVDSGFDVQHMLRTICRSRTYQQSMATNSWNEDDTINYSHALPRRLPAEVLFDAIHQATGSPSRMEGLPVGLRAAQLPDAGISLPFLDDFGRPPRESACECERSGGVVLGPIMKLINGPTVNDALVDPQNELARLVATQPDDRQLIEEIFLRFLGRRPTDQELELGRDSLRAAQDDQRLAQERLSAHEQQLVQQMREWEAGLPRPVEWFVMNNLELQSTAGAHLQQDSTGAVRVTGTLAQDTYQIRGSTSLDRLTGVRLEALADATLPAGGPGRADNGNFVVNELQLLAQVAAEGDVPVPVALRGAHADFSQDGWDVSGAIDGNERSGWAVMPRFNESHVAVFETTEGLALSPDTILRFKLVQRFSDGKHALGKFRLSVTGSVPPFSGPRLPEAIAAIVATSADQRSAAQQEQLRNYYFQQDSEHQRLTALLAMTTAQAKQYRLTGVQDLAWALINTPAFLFNR